MAAVKPAKALAIVNNRDLLEKVAEKLRYHNISANYIHGESTQQDRKRIMNAFKSGELKLLLATDLVARGLDFDDISVVFSMTASENPNDYLHKAGRTGRCGKDGMCISLVSQKEIPMYQACEKQFGIKMQKKYLREGKLIDQK
ncbi:DEAD-box ATP-dependent RNA helicase CshC [bioreactor metagenome]|uniref:DEAD-box ATP-dependent RNA helicase CshC n=1 Tax=bioreactor metagenome TaxID=1076179 RepID=A0A645E8P6_9ZZZZ